jgi:Holliday junction DNA helicase RuvA
MIGQLRGVLIEKKPPFLLVDVHGVGYEVQASMNTFYALPTVGTQLFIYTHLIVREDAQLLYGFANETERVLFRELIKISGVGPKLALAILSGMDVVSFVQCIADRDSARLFKIPGVGKKTAERLIVEMQDNLDNKFSISKQSFSEILLASDNSSPANLAQQDAVSALISLGYKPQDAHATIRKVFVENSDSETLIRLALQAKAK